MNAASAATSPEMLSEAMIAKLKVPDCALSPWLRSSA